ncbi:hypothetical protein SAMN05192533_11089 [Mesobacillus persicus]|uniref:Uncharacterized protein n=1 Tax=Mesobacillus persicus TaxID=930146 RepID=A0A1H8EU20_9BACI|nr:hypothetical protein SAMN05192533_11089 [Mesobacillus persicus]
MSGLTKNWMVPGAIQFLDFKNLTDGGLHRKIHLHHLIL